MHVMQHEISKDAYNRLTSTPDAKGRKIEVIKVPVPYPLFRTHKEANGVHVSGLPLVIIVIVVSVIVIIIIINYRYFS